MKALLTKLWTALAPWLRKVTSEDNGNPSSMRVTLLVWHLAAAFVWTTLCIMRREMVHIDESVLVLLGGMTGFKLGQKPLEAKTAPAAIDTPPGA